MERSSACAAIVSPVVRTPALLLSGNDPRSTSRPNPLESGADSDDLFANSCPRCDVTLQNVLDRVKQYLRSKRPSTPERGQFTAQEARENRASSVTALQHEVRRIQQEITDLNALQESGTAGGDGDSKANESRMAALQDELARKQKELAKYQARV
jgi:hypothetical protein